MIKLSEIANQLNDVEHEGSDPAVRTVSTPGEGSEDEVEIWLEEPVDATVPVIADADLEVIQNPPALLRVNDLSGQLPAVLALFQETDERKGIHETACVAEDFQYDDPVHVGPGACVGENVSVGSNVYIGSGVSIRGEVSIGDDTVLRPGVRIESPAEIGRSCLIHPNVVIGAEGFGFNQKDGRNVKIPQVGSVTIEDHVEIGACTCIDRSTMGTTRIGEGTKIDDHVMIGHNCKIGEHCVISAMTGIAGSCVLGDYVQLAGMVGIADHVELADRVKVAGGSGIESDCLEEGTVLFGYLAQEFHSELKQQSRIRKLPDLFDRMRRLENHLGMDDLEEPNEDGSE